MLGAANERRECQRRGGEGRNAGSSKHATRVSKGGERRDAMLGAVSERRECQRRGEEGRNVGSSALSFPQAQQLVQAPSSPLYSLA